MKQFEFTATTTIEAKNEEEAKDIFANNSFDFASTAEIEEINTKPIPNKNFESDKLNKSFEISSICREDLINYLGKEKTLKINNSQMKNIASKMGEYHMYTYWDDLQLILRYWKII